MRTHCLPSALKQRHCHYFTPGDVTCACGRFPSELGLRQGLTEHPEREPLFDPEAIIQEVWREREAERLSDHDFKANARASSSL